MDIPFVFSNKLQFKLLRHIVFWGLMLTYQVTLDSIVSTFFEEATYDAFKQSLHIAIAYLPGQFILVYTLLYFIIPRYTLKAKYLSTAVLVLLTLVLAGFANELSYRIATSASVNFFPAGGLHSLGVHRTLGVGGLAAFIRITKFWYQNRYLNSRLEKEKLEAELQILKAQIHPHFLFNTLNNIYSITQNTSSEASDMLLRLSALLRYILYECNLAEIPLSQEFKVINDYILLESIRYGKSLDVSTKWPENADHFLVTPLLLLPLIENCFKHGTSKMLDQPWINVQAELKENILCIKLMNSRPRYIDSSGENTGIGLINVKKRLDYLYPEKYELKVLPETDMFVVILKIELSMINSKKND